MPCVDGSRAEWTTRRKSNLLLHMLICTALAVLGATEGLAAEYRPAEKTQSRIFQFVAFGGAAALRDLVGKRVKVSGETNELKDGGMAGLEDVVG